MLYLISFTPAKRHEQVSRTDPWHRSVTPNSVLVQLQGQCAREAFQLNSEGGSKSLSKFISLLVYDMYHVLTGQELKYQVEQRTTYGQMVSDFSYQVDDRVHILGEDKSPNSHEFPDEITASSGNSWDR